MRREGAEAILECVEPRWDRINEDVRRDFYSTLGDQVARLKLLYYPDRL